MVLILQILLKKTKYRKDGSDFKDKINKIDRKIPDISSLAKKQILIPMLLKEKAKYLALLV